MLYFIEIYKHTHKDEFSKQIQSQVLLLFSVESNLCMVHVPFKHNIHVARHRITVVQSSTFADPSASGPSRW